MNKALLVIDTQDSFYHTPYWSVRDIPDFQHNLTQLIGAFQRNQWKVVKILHSREDVADSPFNPASGFVKPMAFLDTQFDKTFYKSVHNAFTDTGLATWLKRAKIDCVVISGIRTEQCCETTARIASDLGFDVEFVTDATLTFDMQHQPSGKQFSAQAIKTRTELVLAERFATVHRTRDYLA
ncbi:isochorismatase family protein [Pseudoalteromonas sp. McH1-42]|uniref:isochorismatase family protein n=1 Tax=Pseudoalteromonas sp. McH1-42 TaxID=2917752 RepID=UPI001EF44BA7|nr:isochorismatase family protein [Pseudoalteromonas sp. McH1-42]MCG7561366.1 isochorismatase family protein [Pseudoalteromonas sp. McH1-42]